MLINFSVENFRSFGAEQTLNMIASNKFHDHPDHCVPINETDKSVLRIGVIYGANAAGKSNLVHAINFAKGLIMGTHSFKSVAINQFRFSSRRKSSSFEFRYLVNERIFVYGFSINQKGVAHEWLEATTSKGREVEIFDRKGQDIAIGNLNAFGEDGETPAKALKAHKLLGVRPDQLLLNRIFEQYAPHRGELLDQAVWWFTDCLTTIQPNSSFTPLIDFLEHDNDFRRFAGEFLQNVGTGIKDLRIEQTEISANKIPKELLEGLQPTKNEEPYITMGGPGVTLQLDPEDPTRVIRRNLAARHHVKNSDFSIPFQQESDGTQRCLNLLPALYHLTTSRKVFVIDELDRSMHPLLSHAILKFFAESCPNAYQQMIVTTHETHLLDQDLLRRDEIWFVEKDDKQQTQLYSLADQRIRNDLRIEKGYLQGRFGGIPFIGDTKKLRDMIECPPDKKSHAKKTTA